jgi:hypothetical protein
MRHRHRTLGLLYGNGADVRDPFIVRLEDSQFPLAGLLDAAIAHSLTKWFYRAATSETIPSSSDCFIEGLQGDGGDERVFDGRAGGSLLCHHCHLGDRNKPTRACSVARQCFEPVLRVFAKG